MRDAGSLSRHGRKKHNDSRWRRMEIEARSDDRAAPCIDDRKNPEPVGRLRLRREDPGAVLAIPVTPHR